MQPPGVLIILNSIRVWVSPLSIYKVLMVLNDSRILISYINGPGPRGYIDPDITPIIILYFIFIIVLLNTIRLLPVY